MVRNNLRKGAKQHDMSLSMVRLRSLKKGSEKDDDIYYDRAQDSDFLVFASQYGPFGRCKGDCDYDEDCAGDLVCFQRNGTNNNVPGCDGDYAVLNVDYCIPPDLLEDDDEQRQEEPTASTGSTTTGPTLSPVDPTAYPTTGRPTTARPTATSRPTATVSDDNTAQSPTTASPIASPTASPTAMPTLVPTMTTLVAESQTIRTTDSRDDDQQDEQGIAYPTYAVPPVGPTPSPTSVATDMPTINLSVPPSNNITTNVSESGGSTIASINRGEGFTTSQNANTTSTTMGGSAYYIMGFAFLSLFGLAILGLVVKKRTSRKAATSTDLVAVDDRKSDGPQWGDGSSIAQLTHAFEGNNDGAIEVIDLKSDPSLVSTPSADSFAAEPAPLPYDSSLHDKYPKLFGLPENTDCCCDLDTVEL